MTSITHRFRAHQMAKKTGYDEMALLDIIEAVGSAVWSLQDWGEKAIEKKRVE